MLSIRSADLIEAQQNEKKKIEMMKNKKLKN